MATNEVIVYCQNSFPRILLSTFEDMRKTGELSDVTIKVGSHPFLAHRVILAAGIPYFRSILTKGEVGNKEEMITLTELDPLSLESVLNFAYTGKVTISAENVHPLLMTSEFLQLPQIRDACIGFLSERLSVQNVLKVGALAQSLGHRDLIESSDMYIRENFEALSKSSEFLDLTSSTLKEIISEDNLNVTSEEIVFEAVLNWAKSAPSQRLAVLPDLLSEVRMTYLPSGYLKSRADSEELFSSSKPCMDLVEEVEKCRLSPKEKLGQGATLKWLPRNYKRVGHGIYAISHSHSSGFSVNFWDTIGDEWKCLSSAPLQHVHGVLQATAAMDKIFIFFDGKIATFHLKILQWEVFEVEQTKIAGAVFVCHENIIYCFGSAHECASDRVRCFDVQYKKWLNERKMRTGRCYPGASSLRKHIYVTGGYSGSTNLDIVEKYDPATDEWSQVSSMLTPRFGHGCTDLNGKIYVCGGFDKIAQLHTAEMYDPLIDQWKFISSMRTARQFFSLVPYNSNIFAIGGMIAGYEITRDVEIYDSENGEWNAGLRAPEGYEFAVAIGDSKK